MTTPISHQAILRPGKLIDPWPASNYGTQSLLANTIYATPWLVERPITIDQISLNVFTAGAAGTKARLGIYADGGSAYPAQRIVDAGEVAVDTIGKKDAVLTLPLSLQPGLYWLVVTSNSTPVIGSATVTTSPLGVSEDDYVNNQAGWESDFTYSALPIAFPVRNAGLFQPMLRIFPRLRSLD